MRSQEGVVICSNCWFGGLSAAYQRNSVRPRSTPMAETHLYLMIAPPYLDCAQCGEGLRRAHRQRVEGHKHDGGVVELAAGGRECVDCVAHEVSQEAVGVSHVADDEACKALRRESAKRRGDDGAVSRQEGLVTLRAREVSRVGGVLRLRNQTEQVCAPASCDGEKALRRGGATTRDDSVRSPAWQCRQENVRNCRWRKYYCNACDLLSWAIRSGANKCVHMTGDAIRRPHLLKIIVRRAREDQVKGFGRQLVHLVQAA
eukprot:6171961-Pleurochrysis_carterae.AAC.2